MEGLCEDCMKCKTKYQSMSAARRGHQNCVVLIQSAVDVNKQDDIVNTALICAAHHGLHKCVGLLINAGADVNKQTLYAHTALKEASNNGHDKCVEDLIEQELM